MKTAHFAFIMYDGRHKVMLGSFPMGDVEALAAHLKAMDGRTRLETIEDSLLFKQGSIQIDFPSGHQADNAVVRMAEGLAYAMMADESFDLATILSEHGSWVHNAEDVSYAISTITIDHAEVEALHGFFNIEYNAETN